MKFTKMQGIGNDYIYVNGFREKIADPAAAARSLSDRHFGIGSDGLIIIKPSEQADFEMEMYNADGSRAQMCGNGIRCVAKYVYDNGLTDRTEITVATPGGVKNLELFTAGGQVERVRVDMGAPELAAAAIPIRSDHETVQDEEIVVAGKPYRITGVSMGNPHAVVYVSDVDALALEQIGPLFEHHECFPERVNTEFIQVLDEQTLKMRVWERGSGETLACGTGACAAAVAGVLNGRSRRRVTVRLRGGDLDIDWDEKSGHVFMTGAAKTVYTGEVTWPDKPAR